MYSEITNMKRKYFIIYFFGAIVNTLLCFVLPLYHFLVLPIMIVLGAFIFLVVVAIDLFEKTRLWIGAFFCLGLGILSWLVATYFL